MKVPLLGCRSDPWALCRGRGASGCWLRGNLGHLKELVGELRDVLEPLGRPFDPRAFAVALYLARGAIAQTVLLNLTSMLYVAP